jgi:hypothetical protein
MTEVIILACLISAPEQCEDVILKVDARGGAENCQWVGQLTVVEWAGQHPEYQIKGWKCVG